MLLDEYYINGDQTVQVPAHLNFGKYVLHNLRKYGDKVALVNSETTESITYKEFVQYSVNLASSLMKLGISKGDVVTLGSEKRIILLPTTLSIVLTGATYTTHNLNGGRSIFKHKLSMTKPKYFIGSKLFLEKYSDILESFDCIKTYITLDDIPEKNNIITIQSLMSEIINVENFEPAKVKGQIDTAYILYTSGTTGYPKCISLTHMNCIINSLPDAFNNDNIKTIYISGEWYHNYDTFMSYKFLCGGKRIAYVDDVTVPVILKCIENYQVEVAMLVPYLLNRLCKEENLIKYNLNSLKIIYSRSTLLHSKTIENIKKRFPNLQNVMQGYGMSECGELTSETWGTKGPKSGSVGMASPGITLKVVDIETGKKLGPNQPGEIRLMGPTFMKEYIQIDTSASLDEEGFFKTGDLGFYDEDKYFFIIDRIHEVIECKSHKIIPLQLEIILEQHPDVLEAAVVGIPDPDYGERPMGFVVKKLNSNITEKELIDFMAEESAPFMQLYGGVKFIKELSRSPRGKILRRQLREMLNQSAEVNT